MGMCLMAAGAGALYFQGYLNDHLTRNSCRSVELLQEGDDATQTASSLMCSYLCPCNFDPELQILYAPYGRTLIKGSATEIEQCIPCEGLTNLNPADVLVVNAYLLPYGLNLETCRSMSNDSFKSKFFTNRGQMVFPLLSWLEDTMTCSGMCTGTYIYTFSNVNNGNPNLPAEPCYAPFNDWVDKKFPVFGGLGVAFGALAMVVALLACLQCFIK